MSQKRMKPEDRRQQILEAASNLVGEHGFHDVTRADVAEVLGVAEALVSRYFNPFSTLLDEVANRAVSAEVPDVLAKMLGHSQYSALLDPTSKNIALEHLAAV